MKINKPSNLWIVEFWFNTGDGYDYDNSVIDAPNQHKAILLVKEGMVWNGTNNIYNYKIPRGSKSFKAKKFNVRKNQNIIYN